MHLVYFNGNIIEYNKLSASDVDRAWRYADGGFETIYFNGKNAPLYVYHASRASQHAQAIGVVVQFPDEHKMTEILHALYTQNKITGTARCRLSWFRNSGGFYLPTDDNGSVLIEIFPFEYTNIKREQKAVLYNDQVLVRGKLSPYKKLGAHVHIDASRFAKLMDADDAIVLNQEGNVAEATASNILIRKENTFYAPPVNDGGVEGVMLYFLSKKLPELGYNFQRVSFAPDELMRADEILTVNALRGICCIRSLFGKTYASTSLALNKELPFD